MFIINKGKNKSDSDTLNILYRSGNVFIMDNHLAAAWCWSHLINRESNYYFLHIDRHDDLGFNGSAEGVQKLADEGIDMGDIPITELTDITVELSDNSIRQLFKWDNYINTFSLANPGIFAEAIFSTQQDEETIYPDIEITRKENWLLQDNLLFLLRRRNSASGKWIVNLDIDYFFTEHDEISYQYLTDRFVAIIAGQLNVVLAENLIEVLTIAMSPECCGGWDESIRITNLIAQRLEIDFNYE